MLLLDVAEAADFFRDRGETNRQVMILGRKPGEHFAEQAMLPYDAALRGVMHGACATPAAAQR